MYIITLYSIIVGLVIWAVGSYFTVQELQRQLAALRGETVDLRASLCEKSEQLARQSFELLRRDRLKAQDESLIREMSHMASSVEEWPSVIMMQGNGEKDSLA